MSAWTGIITTSKAAAAVAFVAAVAVSAAQAQVGSSGDGVVPPECGLLQPDPRTLSTDSCLACHPLSRTHPVDVDYAVVATQRPDSYRSADEVTRRGVRLVNGQVKCVTCHDGSSPWKDAIALPPGAPIIAAVQLGKPSTYETVASTTLTLPPGSAVSPGPLCTACHAFDR